MKPYSEYKNSEVEWLGNVPKGWEILPLFSVAKERKEPNIGMIENNLLSLSYGKIINKDINTLDGLLPASFETYQIVHTGDIIFRLTDLQNDKRSLRTAIVSQTGIITSAYLAVKPCRIENRFFNYLLRAYDLMKVFYSMGAGLRQSMQFDDIKRLPIVLPEPVEQILISNFLDYETAKIDALIEEQKRLVSLLKEKRLAVISHAVTKGLDPNVPMKESGVEWLGNVPIDWKVKRIRHLVKLNPSKTELHLSPDTQVSFVPMEKVTNQGELILDENRDLSIVEQGFTYFRDGDVVVAKITPCFQNGKGSKAIGLTNGVGFGTTELHVLRPDSNTVDSDYIYYVTQSDYFLYLGEYEMRGVAGQQRVTDEFIRNYPVAYPPSLTEQQKVVTYIRKKLDLFSRLEKEARNAIELMKEHRTALISAAVTGKIDVRGWRSPEVKTTAKYQSNQDHDEYQIAAEETARYG